MEPKKITYADIVEQLRRLDEMGPLDSIILSPDIYKDKELLGKFLYGLSELEAGRNPFREEED